MSKSMHLLTIVGARPQFIKAAAISRTIDTEFIGRIRESVLHTGQHYDSNMSRIFFDEMSMREPDVQLNVGSAAHGTQTAQMLEGIEQALLKLTPDALLVYGDTNSTLAGALAAAKLGVAVVHVEAGLRSFNKSMPEEINRITADHCSSLLFSPTPKGIENLVSEGFSDRKEGPATIDRPVLYECGDVMLDNALHFRDLAKDKTSFLDEIGLREVKFALCTIHRPQNTDDPKKLQNILEGLIGIGLDLDLKIAFPVHPRTKIKLNTAGDHIQELINHERFVFLQPASYIDMLTLEHNCEIVLTDSGGVQKEAFFAKKPCVVMRPETEWVELVDNGNAILSDSDADRMQKAASDLMKAQLTFPNFYGDGKAASFICQKILEHLS
jgi:UDP-GlcNAc3NAcA epimerase